MKLDRFDYGILCVIFDQLTGHDDGALLYKARLFGHFATWR